MNNSPYQAFGTRNISEKMDDPDWKKQYNQEHFSIAASHYDKATPLLSLFQDSSWKEYLTSALPDLPAPKILDLACGTGDLCFRAQRRFPDAEILGIDLTREMLILAQQRATIEGPDIRFLEGDIAQLPFPDASFDFVTGGYALRNAPDLVQAIKEIGRVLKSGGMLAILDFAKPEHPALQKFQQCLLAAWGGLWGLVLHGDPKIHSYIGASLRVYPPQSLVIGLLEEQNLFLWKREKFMFGSIEVLILQKTSN